MPNYKYKKRLAPGLKKKMGARTSKGMKHLNQGDMMKMTPSERMKYVRSYRKK